MFESALHPFDFSPTSVQCNGLRFPCCRCFPNLTDDLPRLGLRETEEVRNRKHEFDITGRIIQANLRGQYSLTNVDRRRIEIVNR